MMSPENRFTLFGIMLQSRMISGLFDLKSESGSKSKR